MAYSTILRPRRPKSRTRIWSIRGGGSEALPMVHDGEIDLCVATPAKLMPAALEGEGIFARYGPMPHLRALEATFKLVPSANDGESFIGYAAMTLLAAHGLDQALIESWGGQVFASKRPQQCFQSALDGTADALIQEAIMLPEWNELVDRRGWIPIPVEAQVLENLTEVQGKAGFDLADITSEHWDTAKSGIKALEFSDFLLVVRDDMLDDVAALLTWCLINTRAQFEDQFKHIPSHRCALTYPMSPTEMAKTQIPLRRAARKIYEESGYLPSN